jgi:hypothetical protein
MRLPEVELDSILNRSVATFEEITRFKEYAGSLEKQAYFDGLPFPRYSVETFIKLMTELLLDPELIHKYLIIEPLY